MDKEKEKDYSGLIPLSPSLRRAFHAGIIMPCLITPLFLAACQRPNPTVDLIATSTPRLVPTYTPFPEIEVTPNPKPEVTPVPKIKLVIKALPISEEKPGVGNEVLRNAEIIRDLFLQYPQVGKELSSRVGEVMSYVEKIDQVGPDPTGQKGIPVKLANFSAYQDYQIFEKYGMWERELPLTEENLSSILAWYELEYAQPIEQNPNFQRAVERIKPALKIVNEIIKDKISAEEFLGKSIPQIPETIQGRLLFSDYNGGGHFIAEIFVTDDMKDSNLENYQPLLEYLVGVAPHELIHAWPQALFVGQSSSWSHEKDYEIKKGDTLWDIGQKYGLKVIDILEKNPQIENPDLIFPEQIIKIPQKGEFIWPENRKFHLAHMSMCSLTAPAQEKLGFEPIIEPRIVYIYSRLKENGVEDPYGLIVQAGTKMRGEDLWEVYESLRQKNNLSILSMDELISTNDPVPDFDYCTEEERDAFRAKYFSYLF